MENYLADPLADCVFDEIGETAWLWAMKCPGVGLPF